MQDQIIDRILEKAGHKDLLDVLARKISFSELNSLLLEVYRVRAGAIKPPDLLSAYTANRFVKPADENPGDMLEMERQVLGVSSSFSFTPLDLSPVAPFGSCSAIAAAHQNKVISALRGTEVVADATNLLALHICSLKKGTTGSAYSGKNDMFKYCAIHRHVRAQKYCNPGSLPHFNLFCMVTSGKDEGSYAFEKQNLLEHLQVYKAIFRQILQFEDIKLKLIDYGDSQAPGNMAGVLAGHLEENLADVPVRTVSPVKSDNKYYNKVQFKIYACYKDREYEAADGGFVDWSQKLLGNKKERMLISGLGLNLLLKLSRR